MRLLQFVEGMPLDALRAGLPWTWEDYPGYLDALERRGVGVNVASFIGHSAVRVRVMGEAAMERDAIILADTPIVPWLMPGSQELADAVEEALKVSRGALLQCHGLMAVGKTMHDAAKRAMMLEETAKVLLYCKQFGGELTLIPDEWVQNLAGIREFL